MLVSWTALVAIVAITVGAIFSIAFMVRKRE